MRVDTLSPAEGARKSVKRLGRGIGSGTGKTSGKGHKGQWARSGGGVRPGFEGGQMPLARRIPKRGFHNKWATEYTIINLSQLSGVPAGTVVDFDYVAKESLTKEVKNSAGLKVLGTGEIKVALTVKAAKFSASAKEAIEKAGGTCEVVE
ncbi:MAG: 50S ribosomal protein L15 [Clostridia bacterium]|nr:50S ribosomal protein L15 [Clostridia bacterium]MDE6356556.1 50S ribosomal protein L15 [Clostridia bacterium]